MPGKVLLVGPKVVCPYLKEWLRLDGLMALEIGHRGRYVHKARAIVEKRTAGLVMRL